MSLEDVAAALAPLRALPEEQRGASVVVGAPDGFGGYDEPPSLGGGGGGRGGPRGAVAVDPTGLMGPPGVWAAGEGPEQGAADAPAAWLQQHKAPVARSGHTLTTVRLATATAATAADADAGADADARSRSSVPPPPPPGGELLLLFGGEAATRVEHRLREEFEVTSKVAENYTLTRRAAEGGTYSGEKNLDPMTETWGLEPLDQIVEVGFKELQAPDEQLWEATPPANGPAMSRPRRANLDLTAEKTDAVRPEWRGLGASDFAAHRGSVTYVQRRRALRSLHAFDPASESWVELSPAGLQPEGRLAHAACAVDALDAMLVFGGRRLRECDGGAPCGEALNDVLRLRLRPELRWERPLLGGVPPTPRHGHSMTLLPHLSALNSLASVFGGHGMLGGGGTAGGGGGGLGGVVVFGGSAAHYNASSGETRGTYLNDAHVLDLDAMAWRRLAMHGAPPVPRARHAAAATPDGLRLVLFGGEDDTGSLADLHVLDAARGVWWQVHAAGDYPAPRAVGHAAVCVGDDVLFVGGDLDDTSDAQRGAQTYLLSTRAMELRTTALLAELGALRDGPPGSRLPSLRGECDLHKGTLGATTQVWRCGPMLRQRAPAVPADPGRDGLTDPDASRVRYYTEAGLKAPGWWTPTGETEKAASATQKGQMRER